MNLEKKIAVFYVLVSSLCFVAFLFVLFYGFGYRVNRSASLPFLVYEITPLGGNERIERGDCVTVNLSQFSNPVITQGVERGYVSLREPMLKRIGAVPGDTVTLEDGFLYVNGEAARITIASRDSCGGELSAWPTPLTLQSGQYWLTSDSDRGFDSRYFGPVHRNAFSHRAKPALHQK
jgi:conjugative transfer signal peptidase TraF